METIHYFIAYAVISIVIYLIARTVIYCNSDYDDAVHDGFCYAMCILLSVFWLPALAIISVAFTIGFLSDFCIERPARAIARQFRKSKNTN